MAMRIPFIGGPLDGAVLVMEGLPPGPIGVEMSLDDDEVEMDGATLVVPDKVSRVANHWYDWISDDKEMHTVRMVQTVRESFG